jgi:uncharacterized membrane protein YgcG
MLRIRLWFKIILSLSLGLLASLYLAGCEPDVSLPANTQLYQVEGAQVCDYRYITPTPYDDCNYYNLSPGYYYNPASQLIFYRRYGGDIIEVERNIPSRGLLRPGGTVPMTQPVLTDAGGTPLTDNQGTVVRIPGANRNANAPSVTPIRSSASFEHPTLGTVTAGRTRTGGRGVTFGGRSAGGGSGGGTSYGGRSRGSG